MRTINALDLEHRAHRGPLERGLRYVCVHTGRGLIHWEDDWEPYVGAYEILPVSGLYPTEHGPRFRYISTSHPDWFSETYASDRGLWDVPGISYRNRSNYMLDLHALLREGIVIGGVSRW